MSGQEMPTNGTPPTGASSAASATPAASPTSAASAASPPTATPDKPKSRGCRNCAIGCLGMIVMFAVLLAAGGWFGYTRYARPWFLGARARLYETVPQLEALEGLALDGMGEGLPSGLERDLSGTTDPTAFPADVALPGGRETLATRSGDFGARAVAETRGRTAAALSAELRAEMESLGWSRVPVPDPADGIALRFDKQDGADARTARYELIPQDSGTVRVWVRVTR